MTDPLPLDPLPSAFEFLLAHDVRALVRQVHTDDAPRFERGYQTLSEQSRRLRFFGQSSQLSTRQLQFLTQLDQVRHVAWGALDLGVDGQPGIGVARYIAMPEAPGSAEVAITIVDHYQHHGAGTLLHACLHLTATQHGFTRFVYDVSSANIRFLHYLKAIGAKELSETEHILRLEMPVYAGPDQVPLVAESGQHFAALMRKIAQAKAVVA